MSEGRHNVEFLKEYLNTKSPTGFEEPAQEAWIKYIKEISGGNAVIEVFPDNTVIATKLTKMDDYVRPYKIVIDAHADEISWKVNYIEDSGLIRVTRNGGIDNATAYGKEVTVRTRQGEWLPGVFGLPAIHFRDRTNEKQPQPHDLYVDMGFDSKEEAIESGVEPGMPVLYTDGFDVLNSRYYKARGLDNRIGGFIIAEVLKRLYENEIELPYDLYVVNASQEEIGLKGAIRAAKAIKPDFAIATDVTHHTKTPTVNMAKEGECLCGEGAALSTGYNINRSFLEFTRKCGDNANIKYQITADNAAGNDTHAYANEGAVSMSISIPNKYMHTTAEMVAIEDVDSVIDLMYEVLVNLNPNDFHPITIDY